MATMYKTPGVYIEEIPKLPPSIAPVETAIPAFIGYTEKAKEKEDDDLIRKPIRISSMVEYDDYFGKPEKEKSITVTIDMTTDTQGNVTSLKTTAKADETKRSKHNMYYSLQMFFTNGGGPCYIVSVDKYAALVEADMETTLDTLRKVDEPTLILFPEAQNLSLSDYNDLNEAALEQCKDLQDRFVIIDLHGGSESLNNEKANLNTILTNFRSKTLGTKNQKYGAVYGPNIEATLDFEYDETQTDVVVITNGTAAAAVKMDGLKTSNNDRYEMAKAAISSMPMKMPPSGAIAGIYAAVDEERGVWKAPANVSISKVNKPTFDITAKEQEEMNVDPTAGKSVNAIRSFPGKGTYVWGARTLAGNDNEWRYVNVRRFFIFVEESTKKAAERFVFEPNDANTWVKVQAMIENFLNTLWRQGALQGIKPEHAFYVAVGLGKTMTPLDILEGRMIIEIGLAAVRPAEFIILRFSHKMAES
ncbi:MAG: phage tail sheath C-terminal domain-containing protein [Saprospiraceae bacterium]